MTQRTQPTVVATTMGILPEGWRVSELTVVRPRSGTPIRVWSEHSTSAVDALADELITSACKELAGSETVEVERLGRFGPEVGDRQLFYQRAGIAMVARIACSSSDGVAVVASATWPRDESSDIGNEFDLAVQRWIAGPLSLTSTEPADDDGAVEPDPVTFGDLDRETWRPIIAEWREPARAAPSVVTDSTWSVEELAVATTLLGSGTFPTVGLDWTAALAPVAVDAIIDATTRALLARSALVVNGERVALASELEALLSVALERQLVVDVAMIRSDRTTSHHWFGVTSSGAVAVTVLDEGTRQLRRIPPGDLVAAIVAVMPNDRHTSPGSVPPAETFTLGQVFDGSAGVESITEVTTSWSEEGRRQAGRFYWVADAAGGWLAEPTGPDSWAPGGSDDLRATLVGHLPTGS